MKNLITKFSYLLLFLLISSTSLALETEIIRDLDKWREKIATLDWKNFEENEFRVSVPGSNGSINIDKDKYFDKLEIISVSDVFGEAIKRVVDGTSLSSMFKE